MMLSMISRILRLSGKYKGRLQLAFLFSVLDAILSKLPIFYAMLVISRLYEGTMRAQDRLTAGIAVVVTLLLQILVHHTSDRLQSGAGYLLFADKRLELGNYLRKLPMGYFTEGNIGKISSVLSSDMIYVEENVMQKIANLMSYAFSALILVVFMFVLDWRLGGIALITSALAIVIAQKASCVSMKEASDRQEQSESLTEAVLEFVEGISVIKSYNLLGDKSKELSGNFKVSRDKSVEFEKRVTPWITGLSCLYAIGITGILISGILTYTGGGLSLTYTTGMLLFVLEVFNPLKMLFSETANMTIMESCLNRIEEVMSETTLPDEGKMQLSENGSGKEIRYDHVSFAYGEHEVLRDISFVLPPGTMTALVGQSGSGKTTIASLLARFWEVKAGAISIDGVDIRQLPMGVLMDQVSMVFQRVYLFEDTIYNNILMGRSGATEQEVIEAAKKARCYDFIVKLPNGFQTRIGEGGATLSGGEKQRISIARCILKDAPIVILDEATASVDVDNESYIQEAISELVKGKTMLVIAHRLNTIQAADQILVVSDGTIIQRGKHDELIEQVGTYRDFVHIRNQSTAWSLS